VCGYTASSSPEPCRITDTPTESYEYDAMRVFTCRLQLGDGRHLGSASYAFAKL
jgi:hypothetical protein